MQRGSSFCRACYFSQRSKPSASLPSLRRTYSIDSPKPADTRTTHAQLSGLLKTAKEQAKALQVDQRLRLAAQLTKQRYASAAKRIEQELGVLSQRLSKASGYEEIEDLKRLVGETELALAGRRQAAREAKQAYEQAVAARLTTQREMNDILARKSAWSDSDIAAFPEIVRREHAATQAERQAKEAVALSDEQVDSTFDNMMRHVLARYHEEQVWSDKIRSVSTYGTLLITSINVVLFLLTLIVIEPWKRKRLVAGVEERIRAREDQIAQAVATIQQELSASMQLTNGHLATIVSGLTAVSPDAVLPPTADESQLDDTVVQEVERVLSASDTREATFLQRWSISARQWIAQLALVDWERAETPFGLGLVLGTLCTLCWLY
ncbi:uncharacterized protein L969DRAFT_51678 [Mixia osmundae IAM 14324]|uniref:Sensitive to high expression protein 9, mitochondrial n=1 Tax=Mixia osmundae (strain CBS 9802 / IAM 14324 / JCM 22182 / KY 12970) TaxID=764103 RepID=G7EAB0_MIXOS|nr:uncharacterized protein L969DRAFT_51678 [Mixia osmundae IAM 14324]KEI37829.1 hypothetical protein L969DRAFT_51678 [Mixia osmundae IAM 14324]GAA99770.1 hypothetical protein E5Q_06473 [Mixia osmundae IAM 14324]